MASTTVNPEGHPHDTRYGEDEPLLGRAGDASQRDGSPLYENLILGTGIVAQIGLVLLIGLIWASVFLQPLILFSAHPLLNSAGVLFLAQSILVLQPTHTPTQKRRGTIAHFTLLNLGIDALIAGLVIIEYNKISHGAAHFTSAHGILGLITYIFLAIQALVGFTQYFVPQLYGGVDNAKGIYKWHRLSGYIVLVLMLATIVVSTLTDTVRNMLKLHLWSVLVCIVLILIGVVPRIKKQKFGFQPRATGSYGQ